MSRSVDETVADGHWTIALVMRLHVSSGFADRQAVEKENTFETRLAES